MASTWHCNVNGLTQGPVSSQQLKALADQGKLNPTDTVWKEGMKEWVPAAQIKGLFSAQSGSGPTTPPPHPLPISTETQPRKSRFVFALSATACCFLGVAIVLLVFLLNRKDANTLPEISEPSIATPTGKAPKPDPSPPTTIDNTNDGKANVEVLHASKIVAEYSVDKKRADESYKGKVIKVQGTVRKCLLRSGGGAFLFLNKVYFIFTSRMSNTIDVTTLEDGDDVVIEGRCTGITTNGDVSFENAALLMVNGKLLERSTTVNRWITLEDFKKVTLGMRYPSVTSILDGPGTIKEDRLTSDRFGTWQRHLVVTYSGANGAVAVFTFSGPPSNTLLVNATQRGLR